MTFSSTTPQPGDSKTVTAKKWLAVLQAKSGALPTNNPKLSDSYALTLRKILKSLLNLP